MRSHNRLVVSATMLATVTATSLSFADDPRSRTPPPTGSSGSSVTSPTVMTPSTPSVPTTSTTTTTTQGTTTTTLPPATTSTTTTTAADTESMTPPAPAESITVYNKQLPNRPMLVTGGALLVGTYATSAIIVAANGSKSDGDHDLYIPVVGPWINLSERTCSGDCADHKRDSVLIAGSGVLQGLGAAMVIASFLIPEKVESARITAGPMRMQITPSAVAGGGGIGAFGTF